jgi:hypothetical protein
MAVKVKSSVILAEALVLLESGAQQYICAAIQDAETTRRWATGEDVRSKALEVLMTFRPEKIRDDVKSLAEWWPRGDPARIETLKQAIIKAKRQND